MNVLIDLSVMRTRDSGIARATIALWDAMASLYDNVNVVGASRFETVMGLPRTIKPVQIGRHIPLRKDYWTRLVIPALSLFHKFDFVHFPWNVVPVRPKRDARVILTIHDLIPLALPNLYFQSEEQVATYKSRIEVSINRADLIITDSHCSKKDILKYFEPKSEPVVVYLANTMPTDSRYMGKSDRERETYFVFLGGYEQRKGLDVLVRVYIDLFLEKQISFPLVLIGYPNHYSKELHDDIELGKSCGAIIEMGALSNEVIVGLLSGARALIYPSRYEGFGFPALEAMSVGCPVITTKNSSLPEVCGDAAIYMDSDSKNDIAQAILTVDRNETIRNDLRKRGLIQANNFTWAKSAETMMTALKSLASSRINGACR